MAGKTTYSHGKPGTTYPKKKIAKKKVSAKKAASVFGGMTGGARDAIYRQIERNKKY